MSNDDDERTNTVHYGDKVVTVGERFDTIDKKFELVFKALLGIGVLQVLMMGIHLPEMSPILVTLAKMFH